ncbi:M48 family metalloprotease [Candidatus Babeliales bacterium]|nr:M48 family metalloprotease [Candidatus Babeliales bacterium]
MKKIKNILLLISLFTFQSLFSIETICQEYPELHSFFDSQDYKSRAPKNGIKIIDTGIDGPQGASTNIEFREKKMFFEIVISKNLIDKNILTAEELKFIICHELGHCNDADLLKKVVPITVALFACKVSVCWYTVWNLLKYKTLSAKHVALSGCVFMGCELLKNKLNRDGEYFADRYGFALTKNKEAAISMLNKRKKMSKKKYSYLPKFLAQLLDDHPTEEDRINVL